MVDHLSLTGYERFLFERIIANLDDDGYCRLRNRQLAIKTGTTRKRVVRGIKTLVKQGVLARERDTDERGRVIERRLRIVGDQ